MVHKRRTGVIAYDPVALMVDGQAHHGRASKLLRRREQEVPAPRQVRVNQRSGPKAQPTDAAAKEALLRGLHDEDLLDQLGVERLNPGPPDWVTRAPAYQVAREGQSAIRPGIRTHGQDIARHGAAPAAWKQWPTKPVQQVRVSRLGRASKPSSVRANREVGLLSINLPDTRRPPAAPNVASPGYRTTSRPSMSPYLLHREMSLGGAGFWNQRETVLGRQKVRD